MDAFIQLEKALYCIQQCEIPQILLKISQAGIFTDKSKLQSLLKHILETAMKRPLSVQYYARLCVQLFMKTQFITKDFDFKDYTAKYVFEEASKERDLYRLSFLIQFLHWIKIYGGFTDFYITSMIQKYTSSKSLSFMATMFLFVVFALDLHKNQPLLFLSLKKSYETAASNKILPQVLLQFENYFEDFSSIAQIYSDSFIQALVEDDIDKFTGLCASPFFDPNMKAPFSVLFTPKYPIDCPHLIDCAALCGSEKCFRFILLSMKDFSEKDLESLAKCAVAGGSIPIIRLCIQHGCSLYHLIEVAAEYHRVDILYWMLTFEQSEQSLSAAFDIASRTNDVLSFFVLYSQCGILHGKPIHSAARHGSIDILRVIRHAEIPINVKDFDSTGMSPLHHAVLSGNIQCVKVVSSMGYDIMEKDYTGYTAIDLARINGFTEIQEYLEKKLVEPEEDTEEKAEEEKEKRSGSYWQFILIFISMFLGEQLFTQSNLNYEYTEQIFFENIFVPPMFDTRIYHCPNNNNNRNNN